MFALDTETFLPSLYSYLELPLGDSEHRGPIMAYKHIIKVLREAFETKYGATTGNLMQRHACMDV